MVGPRTREMRRRQSGARVGLHRVLLQTDALLTQRRRTIYPLILLLGFALVIGLSWTGVIRGQSFFPDFAARWTAGRMVLDGHAELYDVAAQQRIQAGLGATGLSYFVSPPFVALLFAPLAALPYAVAAVVWLILNVALLFASWRLVLPLVPPSRREPHLGIVLPVIAAQPVLELLGSGQDSGVVLLLVVLALRAFRAGHDLPAGALLGLTAMKPQLCFLFPLLLLSKTRWRALAGLGLAGCVLLAASLLAVGASGMLTFLRIPWTPLYQQQVQLGQAWKGASVPAWITAAAPGGQQGAWHTGAVVVGLACGVVGVLATRRIPGITESMAVTLASTIVTSPHALNYDMVVALPVLAVLMWVAWTPLTRVTLLAIFVFGWLAAPLHLVTGSVPWPASIAGAPWSALCWAALWLALLRALMTDARIHAGHV